MLLEFIVLDPENISFNQGMLQDSFTLGDAILEHIENKKYSFQDLKSTLDVFNNYLGIELDVEEYKDRLILMAATRHIIVHNNSIVDRKFLKQIRDTVYSDKYSLGKMVEVDENMTTEIGQAISELADQVVASIINRDEQ
jgi:predicted amino acid-binding ACT domain protein